MVEYDVWAEIYDAWIKGAPVPERNRPFYVEEYLREPGHVVELGIGSGRIAIEAARQGKSLTGVDFSAVMLAQCRERAEAAGVADRLTLIQADWRAFELPRPADLVTIPFHSIGHLVTLDEKRAALRWIHDRMAPGGRLIFDHFIFDPEVARGHGVPRLQREFVDPATGRQVLLWSYIVHDRDAQAMRIISWTDELDPEGVVARRKYRRLSFSWITPEQAREMLEESGFRVEALYGDFDRRPFDATSPVQIWVARKPK